MKERKKGRNDTTRHDAKINETKRYDSNDTNSNLAKEPKERSKQRTKERMNE